jgi:signal transduction histidine kinase/ActR/RegA family two-component response regulator
MILTSLTALFSVVDPNRNLWFLVSLLVALNVLTSSVVSYQSYRRGLKTALYVCLGGVAFGILIGLTGASEYGLLPPSKYLIMAPFFGVTLEMISFGLGHAYESRKLHASIELERQMSTESEAQLKVNHALMLEREKSVEFNHSIISNLPVPLILIGNDLRVIRVNQCFIENFKFDHNELQNLIFGSELAPERGGKWNRKELSVFLSDIKEGRGSASTFLFQGEISGRREVYQLNAQRIISQQDNLPQILLVVEDLTEVFESNKNIKSEAALVAQASAAKTSFLANMSHEIRTPLAVIMGYAEILKKDVDSFGKNNSHISKIIKSSEHLLALVDEVLDISKIESGMVAVYPVEIDLLSELKDTFGILTERAKLKGLTLEVEFVGPLPDTVTTCPLRLRQILINVIGNAAKFTDSGGVKIRVSLPDSQKLCFEVEDTGCGLTLVQQKALFQPFVQADPSTSRRYGGSGLGLALSRQLARVMGGDIELRWSEVDKGTCFLITIDPGKISGVRHVDHAKWLSAVEPFPVSTPPVRQLPNLQLLLVEDTPELRYLLKLFLEATGAKVDVAENGEEGVKLCLAKEYDLVFMDIQMPVLDGYQAAAKLLELGYRAPIIALTAHAIKTEQEKCLASGFADYISKPVNSQDLVAMVIKHTLAVPTA